MTAINVTITDKAITLSKKSAPVGDVTFAVKNTGKAQHNFQIAGKTTRALKTNATATLAVKFAKAGPFAYASTLKGDAARITVRDVNNADLHLQTVGGAIELNRLFNGLEIDLQSVSLYKGGSLVNFDDSPLFFSFGALAGGVSYTLAVASQVTKGLGLYTAPVGYVGAFATYAAPVPEPQGVALLLLGLAGVGVAVRRKMR